MKVDLHTHTVFSGDATMTIEDLFAWGAAEKLAAVAITDHESVDAIHEARIKAETTGICLVPGVEVPCSFAGREIHMLMFSDIIDRPDGVRRFLEKDIFEAKRRQVVPVVEALAAGGLPISMEMYDEEVQRSGKGGSPLARLLENKGIAVDKADYARKVTPLLHSDLNGHVYWPSLERATQAAHECDALAVLAHPRAGGIYGKFSESELDQVRDMGIDGFEAFHPEQAADDQEMIRRYAVRHGMRVTGGSDCHGRETRKLGQPGIELPDCTLPSVIHLRDLL